MVTRALVLGVLLFAVCSSVQGRWTSTRKPSTSACGQIEKDTQTKSRYLLINICETKMTISVALSGRGKEYTLEALTAVDLVDLQKGDADFADPKFQILHEKSHTFGSITEYITPTVTYYRQASIYDPKTPTEIHKTSVRVYFPSRARSMDAIKTNTESFSRQDRSAVQYWNRMIKVSYVCLDPSATGPVFTFTIVRKAYLDLSLKKDVYDVRCREGSKVQLITGAWAEKFVESTQQSCIHLLEHKLEEKKKNPWYLLNTCAGTHSVEVFNADSQLVVGKPILVPAGHLVRIADKKYGKFEKLALWRHIPTTGDEPRVYRYIGAYDAPCYVQQEDILRARTTKCFTEDKTAAKYVCVPDKIEFTPVPVQVITTSIPLGRHDTARMEACGSGKPVALDSQWLYRAAHLKSPISYLKATPGKIGK